MKKFAILAGLMTLALFIGVAGTALRADKAEARPEAVISINENVCVFLAAGADWDTVVAPADMTGDGDIGKIDNAIWVCLEVAPGSGLSNPDNLDALADALQGAVDDPDTYADLVDATAAQLGVDDDFGQNLWVLTFVTNDAPLDMDADEGVWESTNFSSSQATCPSAPLLLGPLDDDCNDDGVKDDGVVVDLLDGDGVADLGDAIVTATQSGIDVEMDYVVVGMPDDVGSLTATKETLQEGAEDAACDLGDFAGSIGAAQVTGLLATITDEDGTELTGINVGWEASDEDVLHFALVQADDELTDLVDEEGDEIDLTTTISASGVVAAPQLGCGVDPGDVTVTAFADDDDTIDEEIDLTVVGAPASMTLAANPLSIACNGTNTSEVSATLLDGDGNPVVAGNSVRFEVVALGIANPIIAETDANGVAKSMITPLSGVTSGVTVLVSVVDDPDIEGNILVACTPGPGTIPGPVPTVAPPVVTPPVTGDAGLLP
jgi:Invasin, domain 3